MDCRHCGSRQLSGIVFFEKLYTFIAHGATPLHDKSSKLLDIQEYRVGGCSYST